MSNNELWCENCGPILEDEDFDFEATGETGIGTCKKCAPCADCGEEQCICTKLLIIDYGDDVNE